MVLDLRFRVKGPVLRAYAFNFRVYQDLSLKVQDLVYRV